MRDLSWLEESFRAIDRVYFGDSLSTQGFKVKWMPWRPNKKSFIFGRCYRDEKLIQINKALQYAWVPDYVVLSTLYHEMLHIVIGNEHDTAFKLAEERFVHFLQAELWESQNITKLMECKKPVKEELDLNNTNDIMHNTND